MDVRLGETLVLSHAELAELRTSLPAGWSHPELESLQRGRQPDHPFDAYHLFDIVIRDAIDEHWEPPASAPDESPHEALIQRALDRIVTAHPTMLDEILGWEEAI